MSIKFGDIKLKDKLLLRLKSKEKIRGKPVYEEITKVEEGKEQTIIKRRTIYETKVWHWGKIFDGINWIIHKLHPK